MENSTKAAQKMAEKIIDNMGTVILGKKEAIVLAVIALTTKGHLLIEDAPGVGKTMLARSLAKSIDCT
ncbi:MAG: AAA family ATPase, partial [Chloroflexi bacterium]|nr:AAA family ATPase [Chloroflexota bacterium]